MDARRGPASALHARCCEHEPHTGTRASAVYAECARAARAAWAAARERRERAALARLETEIRRREV